MKIALTADGEPGQRVGRVLLADSRITALGVPRPQPSEPRMEPLAGFTADAVAALNFDHPYVAAATDSDTPVFTVDGRANTIDAGLPALCRALARQMEDSEGVVEQMAWTVADDPLTSGFLVPFPPPLGALQAAADNGGIGLAAPTHSPWGGASVSGRVGGKERSVAVVDDARFLRAVCLAARMTSYITGDHGPGAGFLDDLRAAGVGFAVTSR